MKQNYKVFLPVISSIILFAISIFVVNIISVNEYFTNTLYPNFYNFLYPLYTNIFGWIPFSVGDIFYLILGVLIILYSYYIIRDLIKKQYIKVVNYLSKIIYFTSFIYLFFNVIWGFNYNRTNLIEQYKIKPYNANDLKLIANDLLKKSIEYRTQVKENANGVFEYDKANFNTQIPEQLTPNNTIPFYKTLRNAKKKSSLYSWFMRYFGVSGYYNPFTGESQITTEVPTVSIPFTMAHEQAHQMGYAPEFEANYIGFLTCIESNSVELKYSANYKALKYVLNNIYPQDSTFVKEKINEFSDGMIRDYKSEKQFYKKYSGKADEIFSSLNSFYLKANQQQKGIYSYNQFVDLLVYYYRENEIVQK